MFAKLTKNLGYLITVILTVFLLLFILPNFTIHLGEQRFSWSGIDLTTFGTKSTLANFQYGTDLYSQKHVALLSSYPGIDEVNVKTVFLNDAQAINRRLDAAGIKDVRVITQISGTTYTIVLEFPSTYSDTQARSISSIVASPGVIQFWVHNATGEQNPATEPINSTLLAQLSPDYIPAVASISVSDLSGIAVETRSNLSMGQQLGSGTVWRLRFKEDAATRVNQDIFLASSATPSLLAVDGEPMFVVQGIAGSTEALAIPILLNDNLELKLMSTFLTAPGNIIGTFQSTETVTYPAAYSPEGKTVVAVSILVMVALVVISFVSKYRFRKSMTPIWAFGFMLLLAVGLLKVGSATLSVVLVISTMIWILISKFVVDDIVAADDRLAKLKQFRNLSMWIFIVLLVLANSSYLFGILQEFVLVNAIFAFSLLVCSVLFYKFILIEDKN